MVLLGALINGLEAAVGGVLGLLFKGRVSERLGDFLLKGQGLAVVLVAVQGMMQGGSVAIVTLSLALGSVIGLASTSTCAFVRCDWPSGASTRRLPAPNALGTSRRLRHGFPSSPVRVTAIVGRARVASCLTT